MKVGYSVKEYPPVGAYNVLHLILGKQEIIIVHVPSWKKIEELR